MIPEPAAGIQASAHALAALERQAAVLASLLRALDAARHAWASGGELAGWQGPAGWCYSLAAGQLRSDLTTASEALTVGLRETRSAIRCLAL